MKGKGGGAGCVSLLPVEPSRARRDGLPLRARERSEHGRARSFLLPFLPFYNRKNCIYSMKHAARHAGSARAAACGGTASSRSRLSAALFFPAGKGGRQKNRKDNKDNRICIFVSKELVRNRYKIDTRRRRKDRQKSKRKEGRGERFESVFLSLSYLRGGYRIRKLAFYGGFRLTNVPSRGNYSPRRGNILTPLSEGRHDDDRKSIPER